MNLSKEQLSNLYRDETAPRERTGCPSAEALVRASLEEATRSEREQLADHLSTCSECAKEYQLVRSLGSGSHPEGEAVLPPLGGSVLEFPRPAPRRSWFPPTWPAVSILSAVAAALLIAAVVLGWRAASLYRTSQRLYATLSERDRNVDESRRQLAEASRRGQQYVAQLAELRLDLDRYSRPQLNAPIIDLDPGDSTRGVSAESSRTVSIPAGATMFTLILNIKNRASFPDYSLSILDSAGAPIWSGPGLERSRLDTFTVTVPCSLLPGGEYQLKLFGVRGKRTELLEDYRVRIRRQ